MSSYPHFEGLGNCSFPVHSIAEWRKIQYMAREWLWHFLWIWIYDCLLLGNVLAHKSLPRIENWLDPLTQEKKISVALWRNHPEGVSPLSLRKEKEIFNLIALGATDIYALKSTEEIQGCTSKGRGREGWGAFSMTGTLRIVFHNLEDVERKTRREDLRDKKIRKERGRKCV